MQKLKVAIIGAGSVAHFHAWAVEQLPELATLVAVQSSNLESATAFAAQYSGAKGVRDDRGFAGVGAGRHTGGDPADAPS